MLIRDFANRSLSAAWSAGVLPEPRLDPDALVQAAADSGDPPDPADHHWREPLAALVSSLNQNADLNPVGRSMAWGQLVRVLRDRSRAHRLWREHPEILQRPIPAPVVVLGHMRSGTTRLHRLLACDDRLIHNRLWEVISPVPRARRDWRRAEVWAGLRVVGMLNPALNAIHPTKPDAAEEEFGLFSFSLHGAQFEAQWRTPAFSEYWQSTDRRFVYREYRKLLQTIGWARGDDAARPWVLKAPQLMEDLDLFLDEFPDARLICLNRDLDRVVGSTASLVWNQMRIQSDSACPKWAGAEWLRKTQRRERLSRAVRASRPDVPQIDVSFSAMDRDWACEMQRIYRFLGMELDQKLLRRMAAYRSAAERSGFRNHRYRLGDFGLDRTAIARAMGDARSPCLD